MRRRVTAVMGAAAMVLMASAASAQAPISGKWTIDAEKTAAANPAPQGGQGGGRMGGGMGMGAATVAFEGDKLITERPGREGAIMKTEYKLDGSEQAIGQGQMAAKAKAKWDGATLVIETTRETQNGASTSKEVWSLEGEYLVRTSTRNGRDGTPVTTKAFYKKAS